MRQGCFEPPPPPPPPTPVAWHRNAEGLSWHGQGEMPAWLRRAVNAGQSVEFFVSHITVCSRHQPYSKTRPESNGPRLTVMRWATHGMWRMAHTMLRFLGNMFPGAQGATTGILTIERSTRGWENCPKD